MQYMRTACFTHVHFPIIHIFLRYWSSEMLFNIASEQLLLYQFLNIFVFIVSTTRAQCDQQQQEKNVFFVFSETHTKFVLLCDMIRFLWLWANFARENYCTFYSLVFITFLNIWTILMIEMTGIAHKHWELNTCLLLHWNFDTRFFLKKKKMSRDRALHG